MLGDRLGLRMLHALDQPSSFLERDLPTLGGSWFRCLGENGTVQHSDSLQVESASMPLVNQTNPPVQSEAFDLGFAARAPQTPDERFSTNKVASLKHCVQLARESPDQHVGLNTHGHRFSFQRNDLAKTARAFLTAFDAGTDALDF